MLRILTIALISFCCATSLFAQDTLFKLDREILLVKVQQVGPSEIIYKRTAAPDGPLYVISNSDVWKIVYPDGHVDLFNDPYIQLTDENQLKLHPFSVGLNAFDLMLGVITVQGEYYFGKTGLSMKVPFSMGLSYMAGNKPNRYLYYGTDSYYYYNKDKMFSTGADFHYTVGTLNKRISYFFGVSWEYGQCRFIKNNYNYPYYPPYINETVTQWFTSTGITNGVVFRPTDHLSIGLDLTAGVVVSSQNNNSYFNPMARLGVNMGWRFGNVKS